MRPADSTPSPSEMLIARLLVELESTPKAEWPAAVERYKRDYPAHAAAFDEALAIDASVRPPADAAGPQPRLKDGQRLGPFRVKRFVAKGGMGEVYEAVQDVLNRRVALKVLRHGFVSPTARERFEREQQVLAKLHQTNIVPVHFSGAEGDLQYCAMQFVDGASLHKVVNEVYRRETTLTGKHATPPIRDVVDSLLHPAEELPAASTATQTHVSAAAATPTPSAAPAAPLPLSPQYFNSVAAVMIQVAEAVQHGHEHGVCHRDIKPSNLMIDPAETCWVIDYGLAGAVNGAAADAPNGDPKLTHGPLGTPQYMAPERFAGQSEPRSDVWSLGATLYELLALRPAFPGETWTECERLVTKAEPVELHCLVKSVPPDLTAICRKALAKDAADRYPSARAFAADLRRWTRWEPTSANPGWRTLRPLRLWARRNIGWAVAASLVFLLLLGAVGVSLAVQQRTRDELDRVQKQRQREQTVLEARDITLSEHYGGWSLDALARLEIARGIQPGTDLRDNAVLTFTGLDAQRTVQREFGDGVSSVAFSKDGTRVVLGGTSRWPATGPSHTPTRLWDGTALGGFTESRIAGRGPVAFRADGAAVQLLLPGPGEATLTLWDVDRARKLADVPCPVRKANAPAAVLSADAAFAAVSTAEGTALWRLPLQDGAKPTKLHEWPDAANALAFSPNGRFFAAGTLVGKVTVYEVASGKVVRSFAEGRVEILGLAFGRNFWRREADAQAEGLGNWLLAVGGESSALSVWDLGQSVRVNTFRGSQHAVHAVAFSPDGTTLLSGGRYCPYLWDVASGRRIFALGDRNYGSRDWMTAVAFSPDGRKVVIASEKMFGMDAGVDLWELDESRGIRTFRGLANQSESIWFSPTGRWVAALAQDWHLGVWDARTGRLAFAFEVPTGFTVDNAGLAFDPDEREIAICSGKRLTQWDLESGARIRSLELPAEGLLDRMVELPNGKWLLFRVELGPDGLRGSRTGIVRELDRRGEMKELYRIGEVPPGNDSAQLSWDGKVLLVTGNNRKDEPYARLYDAPSGRRIPIDFPRPLPPSALIVINPLGTRAFMTHSPTEVDPRTEIYDTATGKHIGSHPGHSLTTNGTGDLYFAQGEARNGLGVFRWGETEPLVRLDVGVPLITPESTFSRDGRSLAWGRNDGTLCIADLNEVLKRVAPYAK